MKWSNIPNLITLARFLLIGPVVYFQLKGMYVAALLAFAFAGFSDALDGYLAKQFNWVSKLGSIMDPLADKLLLVSVSIVLTLQGHIPLWLLIIIIGRDVVITCGALAYYALFGDIRMDPRISSKLNTFFQILLVIAILFELAFWPALGHLTTILVYVVAAMGILSGADYVIVWSRLARDRWRTEHER